MHSLTIARHELVSSVRERTVFLLLMIFLGMALASTFIGWSSQRTIQNVYAFSASQLHAEGKPVPPSPLASNPHLFLMKNMIVYIVLIGSLLAISVGHAAGIADRKAGTARVLFAHPVTRTDVITGKMLSVAVLLAAALLLAAAMNALTTLLLSALTWTDLARLAAFYAFSFVFLLGFAFLGLGSGLVMKNDAIALLIPIILWIIVIFVLPGFSSALYPTASLNLVAPQSSVDSPMIHGLHAAIAPVSVSDLYKSTGEQMLGIQDPGAIDRSPHVIPIVAWCLLCLVAGAAAMGRFRPAEAELNE